MSFLFGSGISLAAGMPTTNDITSHVLSGEGMMRHSDGTYNIAPPLYGMADGYVPKLLPFLNLLKEEIDAYYSFNTNRATNYEDICSFVSQIHDSESGEYDNPTLRTLVEGYRHNPLLRDGPWNSPWELIEISSETVNYIKHTVKGLLSIQPTEFRYLDFIKRCYEENLHDRVAVFSLNHDTLLESYFSQNTIPYIDGFNPVNNNLRLSNFQLFDTDSNEKIRLIKLHGSINWYRYRPLPYPSLAIPMVNDLYHIRNSEGVMLDPSESPEMLVGTINKILDYSKSPFAHLHYYFFKVLEDSNIIIVSGVSFNDKSINSRLIDWLSSRGDRKMIVIHPDPENLRINSRPAISRIFHNWENNPQVYFITKRIEEVSWDEIREYI